MTSKILRMEFEFAVRPYENEHGPCYKLTVKPIGALKSYFPKNYERIDSVSAKLPLVHALSFAAMDLKDSLIARQTASGKTLSEEVYFTDPDGKVIAVKPATFTPH